MAAVQWSCSRLDLLAGSFMERSWQFSLVLMYPSWLLFLNNTHLTQRNISFFFMAIHDNYSLFFLSELFSELSHRCHFSRQFHILVHHMQRNVATFRKDRQAILFADLCKCGSAGHGFCLILRVHQITNELLKRGKSPYIPNITQSLLLSCKDRQAVSKKRGGGKDGYIHIYVPYSYLVLV